MVLLEFLFDGQSFRACSVHVIPSFWSLDFFCMYGSSVLLHPWFLFGICSSSFLRFSFSKLLPLAVLVTLYWGYGSMILLDTGDFGSLSSGSRELWTLGNLAVLLCGLWCNGPFPVRWNQGPPGKIHLCGNLSLLRPLSRPGSIILFCATHS